MEMALQRPMAIGELGELEIKVGAKGDKGDVGPAEVQGEKGNVGSRGSNDLKANKVFRELKVI